MTSATSTAGYFASAGTYSAFQLNITLSADIYSITRCYTESVAVRLTVINGFVRKIKIWLRNFGKASHV